MRATHRLCDFLAILQRWPFFRLALAPTKKLGVTTAALLLLPASVVHAQEAPSLVVTTTADVVDPNDGQTSLREALAYAQSPISAVDGFGGNGSGWTFNSNGNAPAGVNADVLTITTNNASIANSVWFNEKVRVKNFTATFRYAQNAGTGGADGMTLTFQNAGLNALGAQGGGLGYGGIESSAAIAINIYGDLTRGIAVFQGGVVDPSQYAALGNGISLVSFPKLFMNPLSWRRSEPKPGEAGL